ncbi:MAG: Gfo/Idh/MocA family oxidoreductase [Henriciella sp.]|nr:Gfo/Idh/MocA family oxidoreductase [Henriciella sp.]
MIRIGLLGTSRVCLDAMIKPASARSDVEIAAAASRSLERANAFARAHQISRAFGSYDDLIRDPQIDLVYIGLPPSAHCEWVIKAVQAGKHVLCEKPLAMNAVEAERMAGVAEQSGTCLIEAVHYRYHPIIMDLLERVTRGNLGPIHLIKAHFNIPVPYREGEFRYRAGLGGGALMDLGCYPVHWARTITGEPATVLQANCQTLGYQVDVASSAVLRFPSGCVAVINCSMDEALPDRLDAGLTIVAENGWIEVDNPLQPEFGSRMMGVINGDRFEQSCTGTTFTYQLDHALAQIRGERAALTGGTDSIENMRVLDAIKAIAVPEDTRPIAAIA